MRDCDDGEPNEIMRQQCCEWNQIYVNCLRCLNSGEYILFANEIVETLWFLIKSVFSHYKFYLRSLRQNLFKIWSCAMPPWLFRLSNHHNYYSIITISYAVWLIRSMLHSLCVENPMDLCANEWTDNLLCRSTSLIWYLSACVLYTQRVHE